MPVSETVKLLLTEVLHLRAQHDRPCGFLDTRLLTVLRHPCLLDKTIAKLEDNFQALRAEFSESQHKAERETNDLTVTIQSLEDAFQELRTELQCKADREK